MRVRVMSEQFNTRDDAVLTKRKTFDAMVTRRTEPASTLVALNHRWVFRMVAAVHHGAHLPTCCARLVWLRVCVGLVGRSVLLEALVVGLVEHPSMFHSFAARV